MPEPLSNPGSSTLEAGPPPYAPGRSSTPASSKMDQELRTAYAAMKGLSMGCIPDAPTLELLQSIQFGLQSLMMMMETKISKLCT